MRKRSGALIIKDKRLLLISETNQGFYWTPGGGLEEDETFEAALARELQEELGTPIAAAVPFLQFIDENANEEVCYFLVSLTSPPKPADTRTRLLHYSKDDYTQNGIPISKRIYEIVYPELIKADLV